MRKLFIILVMLVSTSISLFAQQTWNLQTVNYPLNSSVFDIYFINAQTGIICGYGGILSRTTNSGVNWVKIPNNKNNSYRAISFINNNTGWISGSNYSNSELIKKTTDAGQTWDSLYFDVMDVFTI